VLCRRCRHDNPDENRYCGMCGGRLEMASEPADETPHREAFAEVGAPRSSPSILGLDAELERGAGFQRESTIAGPSFLGIGDEPERKSSKGYSYLLDYDEPRSHRGLWVVLVLLVVGALAALQFRTELRARALPIYASLVARANPKPPSPPPAVVPTPDAAAAQSPSNTPQPAPSADAHDALPSAGVASDAASQQPASAQAAPAKPAESVSAPAAVTKDKPAEPAKPDPVATETPAPKKTPAQPAKLARTAHEKPAAAESPEDDRLLQLAQKYIHGQGVPKDCTQGVAYLRQAMKRASAAADIQMGALYATGTCMPLDRVAAYRWFGSAQQLAPSNAWLSRERDELYAQMSSTERQRANGQ